VNKLGVLLYVCVLNVGGNFEINHFSCKPAPEIVVPEKKNWTDWFIAMDSNRVRFNGVCDLCLLSVTMQSALPEFIVVHSSFFRSFIRSFILLLHRVMSWRFF